MSTDNRQLAPFIHTEKNAPYIYMTILASLVPCIVCGIFYYGIRAAVLILFCMAAFVFADNFCIRITHRRTNRDYFDLSSLVEDSYSLFCCRLIRRLLRRLLLCFLLPLSQSRCSEEQDAT